MPIRRFVLVLATLLSALSAPALSSSALAQAKDATAAGGGSDPALGPVKPGAPCVPGTLVEAWSEGAWYPAVVLDPLRDGRCFVHYDGYGSDDDEALAPQHVRTRR